MVTAEFPSPREDVGGSNSDEQLPSPSNYVSVPSRGLGGLTVYAAEDAIIAELFPYPREDFLGANEAGLTVNVEPTKFPSPLEDVGGSN